MRSVPAARPDAIRRHNVSLLLNEIHCDGALTRAELTQRLGLSRSTIGALVADLTVLGVVEEVVPVGGERAGRPSLVVRPRRDGPFAVAVDVDVSAVTAAAVAVGGEILATEVLQNESGPPTVHEVAEFVVQALPRLRRGVGPGAWPVGIGVSVPGTVNRRTGVVGFAPNLMWRHVAFGDVLAGLAPDGLPVEIGNDADLAVLSEHLRGAGRDCDDLIYVIGRIGVGAGIIVGGSPLYGHDGHAGEIGHIVMDTSGPQCHCGQRGCVETYVSEGALMALAGRTQPVTDAAVAELFSDARAGEPAATRAVRGVAEHLGRTIATLVNTLNPQRVVLGGSFTDILDVARADVEDALERFALDAPAGTVELVGPALAGNSALLGAAEIGFAGLLGDPLSAGATLS